MVRIDIYELSKELESYVIKIRRDLHENPEIGGSEERTIDLVKSELESMGINTEVVPHGGIVGILEGDNPGKTLILRADMDALPMKESEINLKGPKVCISRNSTAAHMCGHDGHTAMLLGAAKILMENKDKIKGKIVFAFEQGEERAYGILPLLNRLLEIGAEGIWGIHLFSDVPSGKISVGSGPRMAGSVSLSVKIRGKGGHGSRPDLANNPLDCFLSIYNNLMTMRVKSINPFYPITLSIGEVHMGTVANIIPEELTFNGTIRFLNYENSGKPAVQQFKKIVDNICKLNDCEYEFIGRKPSATDILVYNNEDCAEIASRAVEKALGKDALYNSDPWMASESMSLYMKYFPGVFAFLGIHNEEKGTGAGHHNPHFDLDEDVFKLGVAATAQYAIEFLTHKKPISFNTYEKRPSELLEEIGLI